MPDQAGGSPLLNRGELDSQTESVPQIIESACLVDVLGRGVKRFKKFFS